MTKVLTVAEMAGREIVRRRVVLALLLLLPLAFYLARRDVHPGQSIRFLFLGVAWAVAAAALFTAGASRSIEPRLRLSGYGSHHLYLGRMAALTAVGIVLAVPLAVLIALDHPFVRDEGVAIALVFCVTIAAPFGMLLGMVVPRDLEGTLLLLVMVGLQMMIDPADDVAKLLPFWSSREIGTYAVDHTDTGYLFRGIAHGVGFTLGLTLLVALVSTVKLRRRAHVRLSDPVA
jgi:hypothetical protein